MNQKPTIGITGAGGFIGSELVKHFKNIGWKVIAYVHHFPKIHESETRYLRLNLVEKIDELTFKGLDHLIHCAYIKHENNEKSDQLNLIGTKRIIEQCRKQDVKLVFLSSFSAHEKASSHYGKNKMEVEQLFESQKDLILKPGLVLGNGGGLFQTIVKVIKENRIIPLIGGGNQALQTIALDDLSKIIEYGIKNNMTGKYMIAEPIPFRVKEFYEIIAKRLNKKNIFIPVPMDLMYGVCKLAEKFHLKLPASSENVLGLKSLRSFDTESDLRQFNIQVKDCRSSIENIIKQ